MPEFILDKGDAQKQREFRDLSYFVQGYIKCMFFTCEATGVSTKEWQATEDHAEGSFPGDVGFADLAPDALSEIIADCEAFQKKAEALLEEAHERGYSEERAGHDFWLTRNGHGAGFWDRSELEEGDLGDKLSDACRHDNVDPYLGDDGLVYHS